MQRYFIEKENIYLNNGIKYINIDDNDSHHIKDVMRMHLNEQVIACIKNTNIIFLCEVFNISKNVTLKVIEEKEENNELNINVSIAHGLVKRDKQEEVIRRLVEIGAYEYIPVNMARSVIKLKKSDYHFENDRLNRIVKEASEQSHRNNFLKLADVIDFKDLVNNFKNYDLVLYADANKKDDLALRDLLKLEDKRNILVLIGPEGGFSEEEHNLLLNNDLVHTISLGKRILRTETAPLVIMSILAYEVE